MYYPARNQKSKRKTKPSPKEHPSRSRTPFKPQEVLQGTHHFRIKIRVEGNSSRYEFSRIYTVGGDGDKSRGWRKEKGADGDPGVETEKGGAAIDIDWPGSSGRFRHLN
ncbi:hypothetical protein GYMLUDRAFT_71063 [Collybiopsis luxurians FD-317 M1]|nr:hypothetical protein GYMLUDRAFT_71063 [Collybiopsis luxurians FD-317 M1]